MKKNNMRPTSSKTQSTTLSDKLPTNLVNTESNFNKIQPTDQFQQYMQQQFKKIPQLKNQYQTLNLQNTQLAHQISKPFDKKIFDKKTTSDNQLNKKQQQKKRQINKQFKNSASKKQILKHQQQTQIKSWIYNPPIKNRLHKKNDKKQKDIQKEKPQQLKSTNPNQRKQLNQIQMRLKQRQSTNQQLNKFLNQRKKNEKYINKIQQVIQQISQTAKSQINRSVYLNNLDLKVFFKKQNNQNISQQQLEKQFDKIEMNQTFKEEQQLEKSFQFLNQLSSEQVKKRSLFITQNLRKSQLQRQKLIKLLTNQNQVKSNGNSSIKSMQQLNQEYNKNSKQKSQLNKFIQINKLKASNQIYYQCDHLMQKQKKRLQELLNDVPIQNPYQQAREKYGELFIDKQLESDQTLFKEDLPKEKVLKQFAKNKLITQKLNIINENLKQLLSNNEPESKQRIMQQIELLRKNHNGQSESNDYKRNLILFQELQKNNKQIILQLNNLSSNNTQNQLYKINLQIKQVLNLYDNLQKQQQQYNRQKQYNQIQKCKIIIQKELLFLNEVKINIQNKQNKINEINQEIDKLNQKDEEIFQLNNQQIIDQQTTEQIINRIEVKAKQEIQKDNQLNYFQ